MLVPQEVWGHHSFYKIQTERLLEHDAKLCVMHGFKIHRQSLAHHHGQDCMVDALKFHLRQYCTYLQRGYKDKKHLFLDVITTSSQISSGASVRNAVGQLYSTSTFLQGTSGSIMFQEMPCSVLLLPRTSCLSCPRHGEKQSLKLLSLLI